MFVFLMFFVILSATCKTIFAESDTNTVKTVRETFVRIPEKEMKTVLDKEPEGIFIPYKEYKRLHQKALRRFLEKKEVIETAWQGPVITRANYRGVMKGNRISFQAEFDILKNSKGPSLLAFPFRLLSGSVNVNDEFSMMKGVSIWRALINGETAHLYLKDRLPSIIIPDAGTFKLQVNFDVPVTFRGKSSGNKGYAAFEIPKAHIGELSILSDLFYDIKLENHPIQSKKLLPDPSGKDRIETFGFVGNMDVVRIRVHNRRSFAKTGIKISSREKIMKHVSRHEIKTEALYNIRVRDGRVGFITLDIPESVEIHDVKGAGVSGWKIEKESEKNTLQIDFFVPIADKTRFTVKARKAVDTNAQRFSLTDLRIQDLFQREGEVLIYYAKDVRLRIENEISAFSLVSQEPVSQKTASDNSRPFVYIRGSERLYGSYRIFKPAYKINCRFVLTLSRIQAEYDQALSLGRSKVRFSQRVHLSGFLRPRAYFNFTFPDNFLLLDIRVLLNGTEIQSFHESDSQNRRVAVETLRPAGPDDRLSIFFDTEKIFDDEILKDKPAKIRIPKIMPVDEHIARGKFRLSVDLRYLIEDIDLHGFTPLREDAKLAGTAGGSKHLLYRFEGAEAGGALKLSLRKPEITAETVSFITIDGDQIMGNAFIRYAVSNGEKKVFHFAVPAWEGAQVNITGAGIKEKKIIHMETAENIILEPAIKAVLERKHHDIWQVVLQNEISGQYLLGIDFQKKAEAFESFFEVPLPIPLGIKNDTGFLVLEASKTTAIRTRKSGLNEVETYELPTWPLYKPSKRIIESLRYFTRPFVYETAIRKRDELPVLSAYIASEEMVYTAGDDSNVFFQYTATVRNAGLQSLEIRLPEAYTLWSAMLNGKGIKPGKGENDSLLIKLPRDGDATLKLTGIVSTTTKSAITKTLMLASPELSIPCFASRLRLYYPESYTLLSAKGNFEEISARFYDVPYIVGLFNVMTNLVQTIGTIDIIPRYRGRRKIEPAAPERKYPAEDHFIDKKDAASDKKRSDGIELQDEKLSILPEGRKEKLRIEPMEDRKPARFPEYSMIAPSRQKVSEGQAFPRQQGQRISRKQTMQGLLSLDIPIPHSGQEFRCEKLWGNGRLTVRLLAQEWKKSLFVAAVLAFLFMGCFFHKMKIIAPLIFFLTTLLIFTIIPFIGLKGFTFLFNGAVLGSFIYMLFSFIIRFARKIEIGLLIAIVTLCGFQSEASAEKTAKPFPWVRIYAPYKGSAPETLTDDQGVYIPAADYFDLKFLADPPYKLPHKFKYDNDYDIVSFNATGKDQVDRIRFSARVDLFVNHDQWIMAGLPFTGVSMESVTLDGKRIPVNMMSEGPLKTKPQAPLTSVYEIPVLGIGHHVINLVFYAEVLSVPGKKSVDFKFPRCLSSAFSVHISGKDSIIDGKSPANGFATERLPDAARVTIAASMEDRIHFAWFPRKFFREAEKPLLFADCKAALYADYDHIGILQKLKMRVEKSSIVSLSLLGPQGVKIVDVFSDAVKSWKVKSSEHGPVLTILLKKETADAFEVSIRARFDAPVGQRFPALFLKPLQAERIQGRFDIFAREDLEVLADDIKGLIVSGSDKGTTASDALAEDKKTAFNHKKSYTFRNGDFIADFESRLAQTKIYADSSIHYKIAETQKSGVSENQKSGFSESQKSDFSKKSDFLLTRLSIEMNVRLRVESGTLSRVLLTPPSDYDLIHVVADSIADPIHYGNTYSNKSIVCIHLLPQLFF